MKIIELLSALIKTDLDVDLSMIQKVILKVLQKEVGHISLMLIKKETSLACMCIMEPERPLKLV